MVLSVLMRIQCGMGRFCLIFFASFFLIMKVLCDGYTYKRIPNISAELECCMAKIQKRERESEDLPFSLREVGADRNAMQTETLAMRENP
jgi:hypothetical protein